MSNERVAQTDVLRGDGAHNLLKVDAYMAV